MTFSRQLQVALFAGIAAWVPFHSLSANELVLMQEVLRVPEAARAMAQSLFLLRNGVEAAPYGFLQVPVGSQALTSEEVAGILTGLPGGNGLQFGGKLLGSHLMGLQSGLREILARHLQATLRFAPNIERLDHDPRLPEFVTASDDRILRRLIAARTASSEDRAGQVDELSDGALTFLSDTFGLTPFRALSGRPVAMQSLKLPSVKWFEDKLKKANTALQRARLLLTTHGWIGAHLKGMGISVQNETTVFPDDFVMDSQTAAELGTIYIRSSEIAAELTRGTNFGQPLEVVVGTPPSGGLSQEFAREALRRYGFVSAVLHSPDLQRKIRVIDKKLVSRVLHQIIEVESLVSIGNPEWEAIVAMIRDLNLPEGASMLSEWLTMDQALRGTDPNALIGRQHLDDTLNDWFKRAHRALDTPS